MYYNDCLIDEIKGCEYVFEKWKAKTNMNECIKLNSKWNEEKEKIFQYYNVHHFWDLKTELLEYLLEYAEKLGLKYGINLKEEFKQYQL